MKYINKGKMPGPENLFLIAEYTKYGTVAAYYKGYYNRKFRRYILYPHKLINTPSEEFDKKYISEFDVRME